MGRIKNIVEKSELMIGTIDVRYDISAASLIELVMHYRLPLESACAAFRVGYLQGAKAARAKMKKESTTI
ncbi:MAG: hypothetical protein H2212_15975 [Ruminococcus sp.]|nr:hypothetical protein [Ruminococcus sp.]